ncbi:MAG: thioredoxin fold domain-containing protein [Candidatus Sedimenticola sp. 6PFRAG7]
MSTTRYLAIAALAFFLLPLASHSATNPPTPGKMTGGKQTQHPDWFKESFLDIAEDVEEAKDAEKHVILFMHLNNCPYCYKMTEENFKHAPYTDFIKENFDVIVINMKGDREVAFDENTSVTEKELAEMLKVMYTPTIVFLNPDNKTVARVNGYRSVPDFKHILDYVQEKSYTKTSLANYLDEKKKSDTYVFRDHPQLKKATDLQALADKPLAVLFEDRACVSCDQLHDGHLKRAEISEILKNFTFVRLDALSTDPITDIEGNKTSPKAYAEKLGLNYRPGIVLFDKGKEVIRIESMLYTYHFQEVLRYVGERHYEKYPDDFYEYLGTRSEQILKSGTDIDLSR